MPRACLSSSSSPGQQTNNISSHHPSLAAGGSSGHIYNNQLNQSYSTSSSVGDLTTNNTVVSEGGSDLPLPRGWDLGRDYDGNVYYIDHNNHATTWVDPRDSLTKPASFADCVGDELPVGWEQIIDYRGVYFVNHVDKQVQNTDPRLEWRAMQEDMLRQYLTTAQEDLENKKELCSIKEARLSLAQDEFRHLNSTLSSIHASNTSYHTNHQYKMGPPLPPPPLPGCHSPDLPDYCNLQQLTRAATCSTPLPPPHPPVSPIPPSPGAGRPLLSPAPSTRSGTSDVLNRSQSSCIYENELLYANSRYAAACTANSTASGGGINNYAKNGSNLSLNSTTSTTSTKYDPDLLKADVAHARARVQRLRRELANIHSEVEYKSKGVETLNNVNTKFEMGRGLTPEEALAIRSELQNIQQSLVTGEQEKVQLMKSLACLKEDLTRMEITDSSMDAPPISTADTLSMASQTDLTGEEMVPVGARLAELARLRLQYDESRRNVQELQQRLSSLEERISPGQLESDNDRLLLIQEKEQLLRELRSILSRSRNKRNNEDLRLEIRKLEHDLQQATETSNRCIADRLKTHEEKQYLLHQLKTSMRSVTTLESQLKLLSASTLSMSSSSSLGSLGSSSHASSKGSLSSLSFTDIYGMSTTQAPDPSMLDLQRRVEKILLGGTSSSTSGVGSSAPISATTSTSSVASVAGSNTSILTAGGSNTNINSSNNAMISNYPNNVAVSGFNFAANTATSPTAAAAAGFPMLGNLAGGMIFAGNRGGFSRNQSTEELVHNITATSEQNLNALPPAVNQQQTPVAGSMMMNLMAGSVQGPRKTSSQLSLSPRSSLSSVSPPISPYDAAAGGATSALPSYEQAYMSSQERQRRMHLSLGTTNNPIMLSGSQNIIDSPVDSESGKRMLATAVSTSSLNASGSSSSVNAIGLSPIKRSLKQSQQPTNHRDLELADLTSAILSNNNNPQLPQQSPLLSSPSSITATGSSAFYSGHRRITTGQESVSSDQSAPLSPISESAILSDSSSGHSRLNPASRSVSAAVSDESVAGDSGVFEAASTRSSSNRDNKDDNMGGGLAMNLETAQIQIKLRYSNPDGLLHIGIEKARNLSVLFIPEGKKVCIKAALLPAIANVSYTFCTRALSNLNKPNFGENFPVAISKPKLVTKTLQVNVWAVDGSAGGKDDCLGSAQVSLADFNCTSVSVRWYNVLSFHFMQPEVMRRTTPTPTFRTSIHAKQESEVSSSVGGSRVGTLKEESSDESTIISSQTSTLTRNIGPESMHHHQEDVTFYPLEVEYEGSENEDEEIKVDVVNNFGYPVSVDEGSTSSLQLDSSVTSSSLQLDSSVTSCSIPLDATLTQAKNIPPATPTMKENKETNTDCVYIQPPVIKGRLELGLKGRMDAMKGCASSIVKRSKTFSPTAPINKSEYSCRLNRSDSDSAMPLYRRLPFQRSSRERRSLHFPSGVTANAVSAAGGVNSAIGGGSAYTGGGATVRRSHRVGGVKVKHNETSLDLELDLAAQHSRLQVLKDEITRLKKIKDELARLKDKGERELPAWIGEDTLFIRLIQNMETNEVEKSAEEKKMEKLLRRTAKEIYKLRRTKNRTGQLDAQSFREKMAFLANLKSSVPIVNEEDVVDTDDEVELASLNQEYNFPPGFTYPTYTHPLLHNEIDDTDSSISSPLSTSFTTTATPTPTPSSSSIIMNSNHPSMMGATDTNHRPQAAVSSSLATSTIGGKTRTIISLSEGGLSSIVSTSSQPLLSQVSSSSSAESSLRSGLSTETVDTLTEDDITTSRDHDPIATASQNSTPTPGRAASSQLQRTNTPSQSKPHVERFVYEVDPELGAFV